MEVKKYNPFIVKSSAKPKPKPKPKPPPLPKSTKETKTKPKSKLEARGLALENKKKLDIIYAMGFVKSSRK